MKSHIFNLIIIILFAGFGHNLSAQTPHIYSYDDSAGYLPQLVPFYDDQYYDFTYNIYHGAGNAYTDFHEIAQICGIGCVLPRYHSIENGFYVGLLKFQNGAFIQIDSICIDNVLPTAFLRVPYCYDYDVVYDNCFSLGDTLLPVLELFFDSCHFMNGDTFATLLYYQGDVPDEFWTMLPDVNVIRITDSDEVRFKELVFNHSTQSWIIYHYGHQHFRSTFPIINRTPPPPLPCSDVYGLQGEYTSQQQYNLQWSTNTPHSLYQVAYGPTDADTNDYTVIETTDTFCTVTSQDLCQRYAFRVRPRCRNYFYDTTETWLSWSDTVHFFSPCGDVYGLQGEYTALRQHTLSWSATTPHSLYQVAYGPTDADTDDYAVIETTDTFCTVTSPGLCERYAFRVRARCCNYAYDTNESWRPWSDTVHFFRPCNTVTLFSNDSSWGPVFGSGRYECDSTADIEARPEQGFLFSVWSDGDSNSMRTLTLSGDTTLTAFFAAPAGIDEAASEAGITLSPNPASGSVQILSASPILGADLLSLDGRQILHNSASNATSSHSLSLQLDSVPAGVYIVSVLTTLGHVHLKLVVR